MTDTTTAPAESGEYRISPTIVHETAAEAGARRMAQQEALADEGGPATEATIETGDPPGQPKPAKPPGVDETPPWFKREIAIERQKRRDLEARIAQLTGEAPGPNPPPQAAAPQPLSEPDPAKYPGGEYDAAYLRDVAKYEGRRAFEEHQHQQRQTQTLAALESREREFTALVPDYPDVIEQAAPLLQRLNPTVSEAILTSEAGPAMAYVLGRNPRAIAELAALPPQRALMALGQIEARILASETRSAAAPPDPQTQATATPPRREPPPPIEPWKGTGASSGAAGSMERAAKKLETTGDASEYLAELRKRRKA